MYHMPPVPLPTALVLIQLLVLAFLAFALVFLFLAPFAAIKPGVLSLTSPNITDTISGSVIALINCSECERSTQRIMHENKVEKSDITVCTCAVL
jgi:hypothetical protein